VQLYRAQTKLQKRLATGSRQDEIENNRDQPLARTTLSNKVLPRLHTAPGTRCASANHLLKGALDPVAIGIGDDQSRQELYRTIGQSAIAFINRDTDLWLPHFWQK
jgi:hypothetical protein